MRRQGAIAAAIAALAGFALLGPSDAGAALITFETPGLAGNAVNEQYADDGVTFSNPRAIDYSAAPGFAHSGNVAVDPCFGGDEFCHEPVGVSFTALQRRVRVWVGVSSPLTSPMNVRLRAFDAASNPIATAGIALPVNAARTPIQTQLTVGDLAVAPTIDRVEVTTEDTFTGGLVVDDVEFDAVGPPPPCPATGVPVVTLTNPALGTVVQNNQFLLGGSVDRRGAPITSASIRAQAPLRTAQGFPGLIRPSGGTFGLVNLGGLLNPGTNQITVTATNCAGTGTSVTQGVRYAPIPAGTRFRQLGLEVTQGVQLPFNPIPLVAGTPGAFKRTFARVYLRTEGGPDVANVTGLLFATRPDGSPAPGPASRASIAPVDVKAGATAVETRSVLGRSLNFDLPPEWLAAGRLHLQLGRLEIEGAQSPLPCLECANGLGPGGPAMVTFRKVPPLRVWLIKVPYMDPESGLVSPGDVHLDALASWLRRAYPTSEVRAKYATLPPLATPPGEEGCNTVNAEIAAWIATLPAEDPRTRFYGLVHDDGGDQFMIGCNPIGTHVGSGPTGIPGPTSWDKDQSFGDSYGGHEIGHSFGRDHPGNCGKPVQIRRDFAFPYPGGYIGNAVRDTGGLDVGDADLGIAPRVWDWRSLAADVMTYCDNQWPSDYTYRGILKQLCKEDLARCPESAVLAAGVAPAGVRSAAPRARPRSALAVTAILGIRSGRVSLRQLVARRGLRLSARPRKSAYAIVLKGARGRVIARYPFRLAPASDATSARTAKTLINEVVPFRRGTRRILITKRKRTLVARRVSRHAPKVRILAPNRRKTLKGRVLVRWRGSDGDGGRRSYTLLYSHNGKSYVPIVAGLRKTARRVDLRTLPGGSRARFRVIASDGVRTGADDSRTFRVAAKPPRVRITAPAQGTTLAGGQSVFLQAGVRDMQDLAFPAGNVVWRSSLQGPLGRGAALTTVLVPGVHSISARATNRAGKVTTAAVSVSVSAIPPVVAADIQP